MSPELLARIVSALESFSNPDHWGSFDESGCPKMIGQSDESWIGPQDLHPLHVAEQLIREIQEQSE